MKIPIKYMPIGLVFMIGVITSCRPSPLSFNDKITPTIPSDSTPPTFVTKTSTLTTKPAGLATIPTSTFPIEVQTSLPITPSPTTYQTTIKTPRLSWQDTLTPGQYLLFWKSTGQTSNSLIAKSRDGNSEYTLMTGLSKIGVISPDYERMIIRVGEIGSNDFRLAIRNLVDGSTTEIPNIKNCTELNWSPDGDKIVASCIDGIRVISLSNGHYVNITSWLVIVDNANWSTPIWSPDGKWIAYLNRPDIHIYLSSGLYVTDVSCLSDVTTCPSKTVGPFSQALYPPFAWSPDSQYLATTLGTSISILDFNRNIYQEIFSVQHGYLPQSIAWSPDGEYIGFDIFETDLYIVRAKDGRVIYHDPTFYNLVLNWITIPHPWVSGDVYSITQDGANLNMRDYPALNGTVLRKLHPGNKVTILSGPREADGYTWWQMQAEDGTIGWAVNIPEWYAPVDTTKTITPSR
jgi:hypothetical protein